MKLLLLLLAAYLLPAQPIHSLLPNPGRFTLSDGLLIHWNANAIKPGSEAIEAFDRDGARVLGINLYPLLPSAKEISIDDVAVKRGNSIAIAAVSLDKDGQVRPWLLQLDWNAKLTNLTPLDSANELGWIAFDDMEEEYRRVKLRTADLGQLIAEKALIKADRALAAA